VGAASHARQAGDPVRLSGRLVFQIVLGVFMALLLLVFVIQPAVARGGFGEILIVAGIFLVVLFVERWLRTR
jgi:uncharacterized membrane protein